MTLKEGKHLKGKEAYLVIERVEALTRLPLSTFKCFCLYRGIVDDATFPSPHPLNNVPAASGVGRQAVEVVDVARRDAMLQKRWWPRLL